MVKEMIIKLVIDYPYIKENYKMIAIKQQGLDTNSKAAQEINFTTNLNQAGKTVFSIYEEVKETILDFSQEFLKLL